MNKILRVRQAVTPRAGGFGKRKSPGLCLDITVHNGSMTKRKRDQLAQELSRLKTSGMVLHYGLSRQSIDVKLHGTELHPEVTLACYRAIGDFFLLEIMPDLTDRSARMPAMPLNIYVMNWNGSRYDQRVTPDRAELPEEELVA